jgi:Lrp/AsnC family leucine-responsive transcriptional regulator
MKTREPFHLDTSRAVDETDWALLEALQEDARTSYAELGRRVGLSSPAVAERVKRLEEGGVVRGYRAELGLSKIGLPVIAFVRIRYPSGDYRPIRRALEDERQILECHHVTGEDCFVAKVAAGSMEELETVVGRLSKLGGTTTSVVFSTVLERRQIRRADLARASGAAGSSR